METLLILISVGVGFFGLDIARKYNIRRIQKKEQLLLEHQAKIKRSKLAGISISVRIIENDKKAANVETLLISQLIAIGARVVIPQDESPNHARLLETLPSDVNLLLLGTLNQTELYWPAETDDQYAVYVKQFEKDYREWKIDCNKGYNFKEPTKRSQRLTKKPAGEHYILNVQLFDRSGGVLYAGVAEAEREEKDSAVKCFTKLTKGVIAAIPDTVWHYL